MKNELDAVSEVREWRRQMMESWKGKEWDDIQQELNERGEKFRREMGKKDAQEKEGAA
jgi:hypothetical protein